MLTINKYLLLSITLVLIVIMIFWVNISYKKPIVDNDLIQEEPVLEGFIMMKAGQMYLIESSDFIPGDADQLSSKELSNKYIMSILRIKGFGNLKGIENGQMVKVWWSEILESNPGKVIVTKIEAVE